MNLILKQSLVRIPDGSSKTDVSRNLTILTAISRDGKIETQFLLTNLILLREFIRNKTIALDYKFYKSLHSEFRKRIPCRKFLVLTSDKTHIDTENCEFVYSDREISAKSRHEEIFVVGKVMAKTFFPTSNRMIIFHLDYDGSSNELFPEIKSVEWNDHPIHGMSHLHESSKTAYYVLEYNRKNGYKVRPRQ